MNETLCFCIENENLYLEQILEDYEYIPIFFLCKSEKNRFLALCTDINRLTCIAVRISLEDTRQLLHGKVPMRDIILRQKEYWDIASYDIILLDSVRNTVVSDFYMHI